MADQQANAESARKPPSAFTRFFFRNVTAVHAFLYRRGVGRAMGKMQTVLLTTRGRKSGREHTVALGALPEGEGWVVIASYGGADVHPGWWLNLLANPTATVQVNEKTMAVSMQEVSDPAEYQRIWSRLVSVAPNYNGYTKKTTRRIPLGLLRPVTQAAR
jgi:deazaflavin-dependent oxidoreductase (nitroreductase family)